MVLAVEIVPTLNMSQGTRKELAFRTLLSLVYRKLAVHSPSAAHNVLVVLADHASEDHHQAKPGMYASHHLQAIDVALVLMHAVSGFRPVALLAQ